MNLTELFLKSFFASFVFFIVFFSQPAFVFAANNVYFADSTPLELGVNSTTNSINGANSIDLGNSINQDSSLTNSNLSNNSLNQVAPGSCVVSTLSPIEAKDILNLTHEGFSGEKLSDGLADSNGDDAVRQREVKDIGKTELVGKDNYDNNTAVKVEAPSNAVGANRFAFLNGLSISGPFGVGFILEDTLRVGKCDYPANQQYLCQIYGEENLSTRTSGVGFKEDLVNSFEAIGDSGKNLAQMALGDEEAAKMKENYLDLDSNDFSTGSFGKGEKIDNVLEVSKFEAKNSTTCNNSACTISTYSAFAKYFNAWLTTDMVVFNIGPTLLHGSYKFFTKLSKNVDSTKFAFAQNIRQKYLDLTSPMSLFGKKRAELFKNIMKEEGMYDLLEGPLLINPAAWSSGAKGEIDKLLKADSPIWKLTPEKRKKFMQAVDLLRAYSKDSAASIASSQLARDAAQKAADAITDPTLKALAKETAEIDYARKIAGIMDDWDEILALDFEAWLKGNEDIFSFGGLAIKQNGFPNDQGFIDVATSQSFNLKKMVQTFRDKGDFSQWASETSAGTYKVAADGVSLQLYRVKPTKIVAENVGLGDLRLHLSKMGSGAYSLKLPDGRYIPLNDSSIKYIESNPLLGGNVNIFESEYAEDIALTPMDFANRLTHTRTTKRPGTAVRNFDDLHNGLIQNDFAPRNYSSLLDMQFAEESKVIQKYFKDPVTAAKLTVLPILYWGSKKGFGNEDYSAFLLPETWTTMKVTQGVDEIYKDSFIDFFVNEGSDQGDMFKRVFTSGVFFWNKIIEMGMETNDFVKENVSKYSGGWFEGSATRDVVGDVAFYSHNENCSNCSGKFSYSDGFLSMSMYSGLKLGAFLVEASSAEVKSKSGSLLVSYAHHADISGKSGGDEGEPTNLATARMDGLTCDQKLRQFGLGWAGPASGGIMEGVQNLAYFAGFGPGLAASLVQQMTIGRELQDCIDDVEGYYIHFYSPPTKEAEKSKSKEVISNEKVSETLADLSEKLESVVNEKTNSNNSDSASKNPVEKSLDSLKTQFEEFSEKSKQSSILQAHLELLAPVRGTIVGKEVFYVWFKDTLMPNSYNTNGKMVTSDGNNSVEVNYETGELKINGRVVLDSDKADHTRLISTDNRLPAQVVPMTLNKASAPNNSSIVIELNSYGELRVVESSVLSCIQKAIFDQSGINYSGNELTQVFGKVKQFSTSKYGNVIARDGKITLEGTAARLMGGSGAKVVVNGYWDSNLIADVNNSAYLGNFTGVTFEYGSIVLKPETNELIIWLRQHADAVLNNSDVKGLMAKISSVSDPLTECPVPAIDLEAIPFPNDELGAKKVSAFNTSMDHLGPFTQFTTDKKIYEFYSKRDESGECKDYFRVRDKETGNILVDEEVVGAIKQDADGTIRFTTADGKEQTLKFDAENGVPKVAFNGGAPETILSAQGPKGSFWYDPNTGQWYPENGLQIPLNQAFKDNGTWLGTDANGNITGLPENKMTFNIGQQSASPLALPSTPQTLFEAILFITLFLLISFGLTHSNSLNKRTKKKKF